ncbi:MAG: bifunctional 4-hydroxy-3-methylbut-2-enyl diphosphate reductase/30S ribosomal protein S1 [Eubacteriaceae bacterium]|nr:bifunctional 4-hydroxy-3-methylbut-2-enyl diphosphate reductase/30S ribosomal protein S1 [Eubacteriaceae bacterium]
MIIRTAENAGFCFGVRRAVESALSEASSRRGEPIYTLGELIHNSGVVSQLRQEGVMTAGDLSEIPDGATVIIRSHGVGEDVYDEIRARGLRLVDATCPNVKSIQNKVEKHHGLGYTIIIVGDRTHPEVIGINGWCENSALIVSDPEQASALELGGPVCVVAQTTSIKEKFDAVCRVIRKKAPDAVVFNTICRATQLRQAETEALSKESDVMIVLGGANSSNTAKLAEISAAHCPRVIHIESPDSLSGYSFCGDERVGITAGASTPQEKIMEVVHIMENTMENWDQSLDDFKRLRVGDIVKGTVVAVNEESVYLDIEDYKSDGIIKKSDFVMDLYTDLPSTVAIGDEVEAMITDMNDGTGNVVLSKIKVDELAALNVTKEKFEAKETVKGKIVKVVKGGMIVDTGFVKAFMPANQYALRYVEDINALLGKEVEGRIIEFDRDKNKIIFSRRVILQEELNAKREEQARRKQAALDAIEEGMVIEAPVKNITNFGVFLDLNGVDGFIHISDLSWKRVAKTEDFCKPGDVLQAKIVEIDQEKGKVRCTVKGLTEEPWVVFTKTYKVGDTIEGTVKSITKFGAFVEIIPMVEGLVHISNLSYDKVESVESVVSVGETVKAKIIEINTEKRKVGLSIKELTEAPKKKIAKNRLYYKEDSTTTLEDAFKKYQN